MPSKGEIVPCKTWYFPLNSPYSQWRWGHWAPPPRKGLPGSCFVVTYSAGIFICQIEADGTEVNLFFTSKIALAKAWASDGLLRKIWKPVSSRLRPIRKFRQWLNQMINRLAWRAITLDIYYFLIAGDGVYKIRAEKPFRRILTDSQIMILMVCLHLFISIR